MSVAHAFVRRPVMTTVATLSVVLFGVLSFLQLPVNDLPAVDYPVIQVQCVSRRDPGDGRHQHRHAARAPVHADYRTGAGHVEEHARARRR